VRAGSQLRVRYRQQRCASTALAPSGSPFALSTPCRKRQCTLVAQHPDAAVRDDLPAPHSGCPSVSRRPSRSPRLSGSGAAQQCNWPPCPPTRSAGQAFFVYSSTSPARAPCLHHVFAPLSQAAPAHQLFACLAGYLHRLGGRVWRPAADRAAARAALGGVYTRDLMRVAGLWLSVMARLRWRRSHDPSRGRGDAQARAFRTSAQVIMNRSPWRRSIGVSFGEKQRPGPAVLPMPELGVLSPSRPGRQVSDRLTAAVSPFFLLTLTPLSYAPRLGAAGWLR